MCTFWSKGYDGTSLQDLESSMGLTRTSIYNAFGNKRQLFETVIGHYQQHILGRLLAALDSGKDIRDGLTKLLNSALDTHFQPDTPGGCLVVLSILEREQHDAHSAELLEHTVQLLRKGLQQRIRDAQRRGELGKHVDAGNAAMTIATTLAGLMVMGKAGFSKPMLRKVVTTTLRLLDD